MTIASTSVGSFMSAPVHWVRDSARLGEVEEVLAERRISCVAVLDDHQHLVGVISRFDLLRVGRLRARTARGDALLDLPDQRARKVMHTGVVTVAPTATLSEAAALMVEHRIHRVFVVEGGRLTGVLSTKDLMRAVMIGRIDAPLSAFMSSPVVCAEVSDTIAQATDALAEAHVQGLVVVDGEWPVGLFTQTEALGASTLPPDAPVEVVMSCALLCLPVNTPLFRAAGLAAGTRARRILAVDHRELRGILTGLDLTRALLS